MEYYPVYKCKRTERRRRRRVIVSGCKLAIRVNGCGIQEKTKTVLMQNLGATNKDYCGIFRNGLYYFSFIEDRKSSTSNNQRGAIPTFSCCNSTILLRNLEGNNEVTTCFCFCVKWGHCET